MSTVEAEVRAGIALLASVKEMFGRKVTPEMIRAWVIALEKRKIEVAEIAPAFAWFLAHDPKFPDVSAFADRAIAARPSVWLVAEAPPPPPQAWREGLTDAQIREHMRQQFGRGNAMASIAKSKSLNAETEDVAAVKAAQIRALRQSGKATPRE